VHFGREVVGPRAHALGPELHQPGRPALLPQRLLDQTAQLLRLPVVRQHLIQQRLQQQQSLVGPPPQAREIGRLSYAIISDRYLNFSTKAGYHFSTVDTYCGASLNKNYIHFRFAGGAADSSRRMRRVRFINTVLSQLEFSIQTRSDLLVARMQKYDRDTILARLVDLGRLTLCTRQLDMLMDSDASPDFFARAFLAGEMDKF